MRVLVYTDSRGVHRPSGSTHQVYTSRLPLVPGLSVTSYTCPYQWTTILDFLNDIATKPELDPGKFDHVILHAGIVDHSPRPLSSARGNLYDPSAVTPADVVQQLFATRKFRNKKIVNRKKDFMDPLFSKATIEEHFSNPFDEIYEGEKTINLYSAEMMVESVVPKLQAIENLIFISSNDFCRGWNGDYTKERPRNITVIEDYSRILCSELESVINLHQWTQGEVKKFTCDNLHLSEDGSNWVFTRVLEALGVRPRDYMRNRKSIGAPKHETPWPLKADDIPSELKSIKMDEPVRLTGDEIRHLKDQYAGGKCIATLVIGVRFKEGDKSRIENLCFLLSWITKHYGDLFEVLIIEQDKSPTRNIRELIPGEYTYEFLYNPTAYNRGWLYNVAVKHSAKSDVVAFCDTDILPGSNFLDCIIDCHGAFDAVSPNRNLYYSSLEEKVTVLETGSYASCPVTEASLKNPTTMAGGMLVVNREAFISIGGFEQYVGYGCEDRALDVTMLALFDPKRVRMDSFAYFHLHHPIHRAERAYFDDIYAHMVENYGCEYTPGLTTTSYIHARCCHEHHDKVKALAIDRAAYIGDANMYRDNSFLTVNGLPPTRRGKLVPVKSAAPIFPPNDVELTKYVEREEFLGKYAAGWAPPVPAGREGADTEALAFFYNRFQGRRCFIIGNGPSLNKLDLGLLTNEYTFAVNSFYYKTRETGFKPTFFVVEDSSVIKENCEEILAYDAPFKFFPSIYKSLHPEQDGTYFFRINRGFYEKASPNYCIPRFSTDITKQAYCGQSVTYINLQLAFYMGFTEVYLIGMDFSYTIPESHTRKGDVLLSDTDDPNHFHKDYFGKGKTWKDPKLDRVLMNYRMADLVYQCAGRKIYNATVGGKLEVFERVNFNGLFHGRDPAFRAQALDLTRPPASTTTAPELEKAPPASPESRSADASPVIQDHNVGSIRLANQLFRAGKYSECVVMCERLYQTRQLRMYKQLADNAKSLLAKVS